MIRLEGVTKLYGKVIGVNDISLTLSNGAYGLLGPNGAGKSTLLNLITGQLRPTMGQVEVLGESPRNNPNLFRSIGYCPGSEGLYANVSALDWVRYLLELHGMSKQEADDRARETLEWVGMTDAMEREISTYSRGMRQRTKLAQAMAHDPKFLILDEPFNGLDPVGRHQMVELLHGWIERGKSLLLASHVLYEVESITKSFMLICGGRLLASGTAEEVHELLVDLPNEVSIECSDPRRLGMSLVEVDGVDSVRIESQRLVVHTRQARQLMEALPALVSDLTLEVTELQSADESLQALFNSLMRIHRGEIA